MTEALAAFSVFFGGLLAGEEVAICYGVRTSLPSLGLPGAIQFRQALIRRLRILVPTIFALTLLSGACATVLAVSSVGFAFRCTGLVVLVGFITVTLAGTVPINQAALAWDATTPPEGWELIVKRWEKLDIARTWLALIAFSLMLAAAVMD